MAEEEIKKTIGNDEDYIETIKKLKETTVSKEEYEKLVADNKKLIETLANGGTIEKEEPKKVDIKALREKLYSDDVNMSNLEFCSTALELRDEIIKQGGGDPFLPVGKQIAPTAEDVQKANQVAEALKSCIDYAEGDSAVFSNELQRITIDAMPQIPNSQFRR